MYTGHKKRAQKAVKAARAISDNLRKDKPETLQRILTNVGYAPSVAASPTVVTNTKAFKDEMAKLGLTQELVATSLVEDIKAKPKYRTQELSLAAKILKMDSQDESNNYVPIVINIERLSIEHNTKEKKSKALDTRTDTLDTGNDSVVE